MSALGAVTPLRRSPLAERHRANGARYVANGEWPASFGDLHREREAVRSAVGLADVGPLDKIVLSGARLEPGAPGPTYVPGKVTTGSLDGHRAELWGLDDVSSLLVLPAADGRSPAAIVAALEEQALEATDVSSLYATLQLTGPRARGVLEELFPVDASDHSLADRGIVFGPLAHVTVVLARLDVCGLPSFSVLVERDQAEYLWEALTHVGGSHGLIPVGAAALVED